MSRPAMRIPSLSGIAARAVVIGGLHVGCLDDLVVREHVLDAVRSGNALLGNARDGPVGADDGVRLVGETGDALRRIIDRIAQMWTELRQKYAAEGPFLFGHFTVADAFYAPVVSRFATYGVRLPEAAKAYADHILNLPAMQEWIDGARAENDFIADDEPYRTALDEETLVAANQ